MKKRCLLTRCFSLFLVLIFCFGMTTTAFAAENVVSSSFDDETAQDSRATLYALMATTMTNNQKTGYFYVPECGVFGNTYYFTFSGDSSNTVYFTIYSEDTGASKYNASYLADGNYNKKTLALPAGNYRIEMSTASSADIFCSIQYAR